MLISIVLGFVVAGLMAIVRLRRGQAGHLSPPQRHELAERCLALGVPRDEVEAMVARFADDELIARHRLEHRRLKAREGPFR